MATFLRDMSADRYGKNVVLLAYSEFGSRVAANASQGTDHGTAGPVFVAGTPIKGGFYGEEPSPTDLDNGDLKPNGLSRRLVRPAGAYHRHRSHTVGRAGRTSVGFLG